MTNSVGCAKCSGISSSDCAGPEQVSDTVVSDTSWLAAQACSRQSRRVARRVCRVESCGRETARALRPSRFFLEPALPAEEADHADERGHERGHDHPEGRLGALAGEEDVHAEDARDERQRQHRDADQREQRAGRRSGGAR